MPGPVAVHALPVVAYTRLDGRHRFTGGNARRVVDRLGNEVLVGPVAGLAICRERDGVVLFGCDADWAPVWATRCVGVAAAQAQAEFEYAGVTGTWERGAAADDRPGPPREGARSAGRGRPWWRFWRRT